MSNKHDSDEIRVGDKVQANGGRALCHVWGVDGDMLALRDQLGAYHVGRRRNYRKVSPADDMTIDQAKEIIQTLYKWVRDLDHSPAPPRSYMLDRTLGDIANDICRDLIPDDEA